MSELFNSIRNCIESILPATADRSETYVNEVLSSAAEISPDENFAVVSDIFDKEFIMYLRPTPENKWDTREHFFSLSGSSGTLVADNTKLKTYLEVLGYTGTNNSIEGYMLAKLRNSVLFVKKELSIDSHFHELFPYFLIMANNNIVIFIDETNKYSVRSTLLFYTQMHNFMWNKDLPAYLKLKVLKMLSTGKRAIVNPKCGWIRHVDVQESKFTPVQCIRVDSILPYITLTRSFRAGLENYKILCRKNMLSNSWKVETVDVSDIENITKPTNILGFPDSFIVKNAETLSAFSKGDFATTNKNPTLVNGFKLLSTTNPLDRIYREGFLHVCNCISDALFEQNITVYMQDLFLFQRENVWYVGMLRREPDSIHCFKKVNYMADAMVKAEAINTHAKFLPIMDRYFTQDIDSTKLTDDDLMTIRECAVYELSTYLDYSDYFDSQALAKMLQVDGVNSFEKDLLNHNLYYLEKSYQSLNMFKVATCLKDTPLDPLGARAKSTKSDIRDNQRIDIAL